jgi:hypothetical protein
MLAFFRLIANWIMSGHVTQVGIAAPDTATDVGGIVVNKVSAVRADHLPTFVPPNFDVGQATFRVPTICRPFDGASEQRAALTIGRLWSAPKAASAFRVWLTAHDLDDRAWTVDDLWYLASTDFAVAHGVGMPPRNTFLCALKKVGGVGIQYDKRIHIEGQMRKTTVYSFARGDHAESAEAVAYDRAA